MKQKLLNLKSWLLMMCLLVGVGNAWAQQVATIATATFDGKNSTYTEGWTTTGTGVSRTDCVVIGKDENITSPSFDLSQYSSVTISINARRFGTISGSKATIDASIGGTSMGTTDATSTNASNSAGSITFTPTSSMTAAVIVFTCTNATSGGSTHGAGIGTITITGKTASSDPYIEDIATVNLTTDATKGEFTYVIGNPVADVNLTAAEKTDVDWISNVAVDQTNKKVTFDVEPNTGAAREATITLTYGTLTKDVTISQAKFVMDYAVLPLKVASGTSSADLKKENGVTLVCDGSDYNNDSHKVKFSKNTHYLQVKTHERIGDCKFDVRGCAGAGSSTFKLFESIDGTTWTEIETLSATFSAKDEDVVLKSTKAFNADSRYLKLAFQKLSNEVNCGLGEFTIEKYTTKGTIDVVAKGLMPGYSDIAPELDFYFATFSSDKDVIIEGGYDLDLFGVYTVSVDPEEGVVSVVDPEDISMAEVTDEEIMAEDGFVTGYYVPANTGVLVISMGNQATYYYVAESESNYLAEIDPDGTNMLQPASKDKSELAGNKFYKLAYENQAMEPASLGFYYGAEDGAAFTSRVGSAYLAVPADAANVKGFRFVVADDATAIKEVQNVECRMQNGVYNLAGQRVAAKDFKGIVIKNGKKMLNK